MANKHFGNLADVFKHIALAEILGTLRPAEYWESHAGAAYYPESESVADIPAERQHGVHAFTRMATDFAALRLSSYHRILSGLYAASPRRIPGSPHLARTLLGENVRRLLFCDTDAQSLLTIHDPGTQGIDSSGMHMDKVECVQDDGVTVLRGAGILLPEPWIPSTLAFIDPYDIHATTDAGISPLNLVCELAGRTIPTVLFYAFNDDAQRAAMHGEFAGAMEKVCLNKKGARRFEGSLRMTPAAGTRPPTQWGFGLLTFNIPPNAQSAVDQKLSALETAYQKAELPGWSAQSPSGAWKYSQAAL
jgi:23S rRNA A2030 N6-methylase RlmJ